MPSVVIERKGSIAYLIMNRPAMLNVLDYDMMLGLRAASFELKNDEAIKCVVVRGAGDHFMAGGDIGYFKKLVDAYALEGESAYPDDIFENIHAVTRNIVSMEKPVIACVKGAAAGFGLSLMLACDLVVAADDSVFSVAYCNIGATPDGGMTYFLPRAVGQKKAMELVLTGEKFSSQQALSWGLLNRVVPSDEVVVVANQLAAQLCKAPQQVIKRSKRLLNQTFSVSLDEQLDNEASSFQQCMLENDFTEGVTAFSERRKAKFSE
ncbi:MAG: enoyl-CoA hydratase [Cycloclasticus sp. symbiont of Bathymodiolus heckerae]|nr:MAG: enoyl-CoA hydratase [Cycloclasticus sp. symbiont of Bathymodiolus heckerae]